MSPSRYRIVIEGELGPRCASAFGGMTLHAHDGETDITGRIIDQPHPQGLLERIASLGLTRHSATPIEIKSARSDRSLTHKQPGSITPTPALLSKGP